MRANRSLASVGPWGAAATVPLLPTRFRSCRAPDPPTRPSGNAAAAALEFGGEGRRGRPLSEGWELESVIETVAFRSPSGACSTSCLELGGVSGTCADTCAKDNARTASSVGDDRLGVPDEVTAFDIPTELVCAFLAPVQRMRREVRDAVHRPPAGGTGHLLIASRVTRHRVAERAMASQRQLLSALSGCAVMTPAPQTTGTRWSYAHTEQYRLDTRCCTTMGACKSMRKWSWMPTWR